MEMKVARGVVQPARLRSISRRLKAQERCTAANAAAAAAVSALLPPPRARK